MSVLRKAAVLGIAALLATAANANAVLFTYAYSGTVFDADDVGGGQAFDPLLGEVGNSIIGEFTISVGSNINLPVGDQSSFVTSASFFDGVRSLSVTGSLPALTFFFGTDSIGNIILPDSTNSVFPPDNFPVSFPLPSLAGTSIPGLLIVAPGAAPPGPAVFDSFGDLIDQDFIRVTSVGDMTQGPGQEDQGFTRSQGTFTLVQDVPEPGSLALLGVGLIGFGLLRRRKR